MTVSRNLRRYTLGFLVVVYTFNFIDRQILAILLPSIKAEFGVGDGFLGFLAGTAFAIFYATLGLPIALLADRWNRRNLIALSLALWSAMTAVSGAAGNVVQLALARVGVGIGEAGCSPAAHSMISDYYAPSERASAMGIFTLGISFGIMIAFLAGGWVAQNIGWRQAFFMVGLPGVILAAVFWATVPEPQRGLSEGRSDSHDRPKLLSVVRFLLKRRSFLGIAVGGGLASFSGYAVTTLFPLYLIRSHGMTQADVGLYLGLTIGIAGGLGIVGGGYLADRIGRRSQRMALSAVATALAAGWLLLFPVMLSAHAWVVLTLFVVPAALTNFYLATTFAQTQSLVPLRMRGVASAVMLFVLNIIGLGFGPWITGTLSDALATDYGAESMRYALLITCATAYPLSALCYWFAGRTIEVDLSRSGAATT